MTPEIPRHDLTLGLLAGGGAMRLGGLDKAWLERDGVPQVLRWRNRFANEVGTVLVSANRDPDRYAAAGLCALPDEVEGAIGPLAGLLTLLHHCATPWLLTLPVDLVGVNDCLVPTLCAERGPAGAFAHDDDGPQPLVALWNRAAAQAAAGEALASGETAIHALQSRLRMPAVRFNGVRFGNLNTFEDLRAAGVRHD